MTTTSDPTLRALSAELLELEARFTWLAGEFERSLLALEAKDRLSPADHIAAAVALIPPGRATAAATTAATYLQSTRGTHLVPVTTNPGLRPRIPEHDENGWLSLQAAADMLGCGVTADGTFDVEDARALKRYGPGRLYNQAEVRQLARAWRNAAKAERSASPSTPDREAAA